MTYSNIMPLLEYFPYAPSVLYLAFASLMALWVKEFSFVTHVIAISIAVVLNFFLSIYFLNIFVEPILALVGGLVLYLLFVYFLGNKVSGETLIVISAAFVLVPIPNGLLALGIGLVTIIAYSAFAMRRQISNFTSEIYAHMSVLSGGRPGYDLLPDRKLLGRNTRKVYAAPFFLIGYAIVLLFVIIF